MISFMCRYVHRFVFRDRTYNRHKIEFQKKIVLGSKKLGTNVLELQYVYVGKP